MHCYTTAGLLSIIALLVSITAARSQQVWEVHGNPRYGFSFAYPSSLFSLERTSAAGDGHIFNAPSQDARLLAGVIVNDDGYTPASYFDHVASTSYAGYTITYRKIGSSWFAISGEKDDKIFPDYAP